MLVEVKIPNPTSLEQGADSLRRRHLSLGIGVKVVVANLQSSVTQEDIIEPFCDGRFDIAASAASHESAKFVENLQSSVTQEDIIEPLDDATRILLQLGMSLTRWILLKYLLRT